MPDENSRPLEDVEAIVEVLLPNGLHTAPANAIAKLASRFQSDIHISRQPSLIIGGELISPEDGEFLDQMNAKSVLALMMLSAECGARLRIIAKGADAAEAVDCLKRYIQREEPRDEWEVSVFRRE